MSAYTNGGDPVEQVLHRVTGVKRSGARWMARCPAHEDGTASLQIARGDDGRALIKCFAGCALPDILGKLGIKTSDLFVQDTHVEPDVIFTYRNMDGTIAYQVVRKAPKEFKQRRPNGGNQWVWNMEGVKRVLYRLPEVLAAERAQEIYIVEGEKDADRLSLYKLTATTNSGGAGKWSDEYSDYLRGRAVVILPDNDRVGKQHGETVAASVYPVARSVRVVHLPGLPTGGDVSDWLDAGHTAAELVSIVDSAPLWEPRTDANTDDTDGSVFVRTDTDPLSIGIGTYKTEGLLRAWEIPEPEARRFAVAGLIPDGAVTLFYGDGGQGKSYIALALAMLSCLGEPFLGRYVEKRTALYLDAELDSTEFVRRAYRIARGLGMTHPPTGLHYYNIGGSLSNAVVQGRVVQARQESEAQFIVFDSLSIGSYAVDASDASDMIGVLKFLEGLGCPVVAIDHIAKPLPGANLSQYRAFGTVFKGNVARSAIQVIKAEGGALTLLHKKSNFSALCDPLHLMLEFEDTDQSVRLVPVSPGDDRLSGIEENLPAMEQTLRELGKYPDGARPEFLSTETSKALSTIKNHLAMLHKHKRAFPVGDGTWRVV